MWLGSQEQMKRCCSCWIWRQSDFLLNIDETVSTCITPSTSCFLKNISFCFFADLNVIVSPPFFVLEILYECIVVSAFCKSIVYENRLKVIFIFSECVVRFSNAILQGSYVLLESSNSVSDFKCIILQDSQYCSVFWAIIPKVSAVCDGILLLSERVFL